MVFISQIIACKENNHQIGEIQLSDCKSFTDDRDGNIYRTVKIGNRCWTTDNMKYLPNVSMPTEESDSLELYYVYNYHGNDVAEAKNLANYGTYGVLYNWPAAMTACPDGWHLPSDEEWKSLEITVGMSPQEADYAGFRGLNEASKLAGNKDLWVNDILVDDFEFGSSGFNAKPGGGRSIYGGLFSFMNYYSFFWSSSKSNENLIHGRTLFYADKRVLRFSDYKHSGFSVRCVKD